MELLKLTEDAEYHVRQWLKWVDDGAKEGAPYFRREGVCHAAYKTFTPQEHRAFKVFTNICEILEQRVGDSNVFHSMDSCRANLTRTLPTTHNNVYRRQFFRLLLEQQGDNHESR